MRYQYRKHHVSKHERDRLARLQWDLFVDKLIAEAIAERNAWITARSQTVEDIKRAEYASLGSGCYWKRPMRGSL